jgi:release factor glutamine methyltransferase
MPSSRAVIRSLELPEHEAARIVAAVTGASLAAVRSGIELSDGEVTRVRVLVDRRLAGEPLQYLEGTAPFGPLDLAVDSRVLIPRPETEGLYERAIAALDGTPEPVVVEVGTGSGAIALAIASTRPDATVVATEVSTDALEVASANRERVGVAVEFLPGSVFEPLPARMAGGVSLIVSNPPYVADGAALPAEVADHEPPVALFGGQDGLDVIRELVFGAAAWLRSGGWLLLEIGESQGSAVLHLLQVAGGDLFGRIERDLAGWDRYLVARHVPIETAAHGMAALARGEVIGMPTDTVYGLAAPIEDAGAIRRLFNIKSRPFDKPIPVLVGSVEQAHEVGAFTAAAERAVDAFWPGALTAIVPMARSLVPGVGDHEARTIGLRMPDHPAALEILRGVGPLAVTSANRSGEEPAPDADAARQALWDAVGVFVGGTGGLGTASTVVDFTASQPRVVRQGPIHL